MREIKKILFIRTDKIGDVLMNVPAIRLLRQNYPKAWITLLADQPLKSLLGDQSDLDEFMGIDAAAVKSNFTSLFVLARRLRRIRYDLVIVSNPDKAWHLLVWMAGISVRVGYARKWGFLLNRTIQDRKDRNDQHEIDNNLELAALVCDKRWDGLFNLGENEADRKAAQSLVQKEVGDKPFLLVHAGSSNARKKWPADKFAALIRELASQNDYAIILIGGEEEKETSASITRLCGTKIIDWTGRLSLGELKSLMRRPSAKALISCDSGPAHIAWMSGLSAIVLYAKNVTGSNPSRWGPRDGKSQVIYEDIQRIEVRDVLAAVKKVLAVQEVTP